MSVKCSDRLIIEGTTLVASDPNKCRRVVIPEGVTIIGKEGMLGCDELTSVKIPSTVTIIDDYAFNYCIKLKKAIIPEGVTRIGIAAFMSCESLKDVVIPKTVEYIGENAFSECNIRSIKVPKNTHLESYVFDDGVEVIRY